MGLMGRYIDQLPSRAKDRLIEAQEWCVAEVVGADGARCLVGHAEGWTAMPADPGWWRGWMDGETGGGAAAGPGLPAGMGVEALCRPELFAFRRAQPMDLEVYRSRLVRWGWSSESRIGFRFDRLCARRGLAEAVRLVKARAARVHAPAEVEGSPGGHSWELNCAKVTTLPPGSRTMSSSAP